MAWCSPCSLRVGGSGLRESGPTHPGRSRPQPPCGPGLVAEHPPSGHRTRDDPSGVWRVLWGGNTKGVADVAWRDTCALQLALQRQDHSLTPHMLSRQGSGKQVWGDGRQRPGNCRRERAPPLREQPTAQMHTQPRGRSSPGAADARPSPGTSPGRHSLSWKVLDSGQDCSPTPRFISTEPEFIGVSANLVQAPSPPLDMWAWTRSEPQSPWARSHGWWPKGCVPLDATYVPYPEEAGGSGAATLLSQRLAA